MLLKRTEVGAVSLQPLESPLPWLWRNYVLRMLFAFGKKETSGNRLFCLSVIAPYDDLGGGLTLSLLMTASCFCGHE